jgi:hypothetical protein
MISDSSAQTNTSNADCTSLGRFAASHTGGPGNSFARHTAALRAAILNSVTERDIQDIVEILLVKAKYGHFPSIKLLFAHVLGKHQGASPADALSPQDQPLSQPVMPSLEALAALLTQPLDDRQAVPEAETPQETSAGRTAEDRAADSRAPRELAVPPPAPSTIGETGPASSTASASASATKHANDKPRTVHAEKRPSTNGEKRPSTNGEKRHRPSRAGFDWLRELRKSVA